VFFADGNAAAGEPRQHSNQVFSPLDFSAPTLSEIVAAARERILTAMPTDGRVAPIRISGGAFTIPADELAWQFARSGGPGGQHVNRTSSKATLRFDVIGSRSLPDEVRGRLLAQCGGRLTRAGELVISSQRHRDQPRNVSDCVAKLAELLERAAARPKRRRKTRVPRAAVVRRREDKKRLSAKKESRRGTAD